MPVSRETGFRLSCEDLDHRMDPVPDDDWTVQGCLDDAAAAESMRPRVEGGVQPGRGWIPG